MGFRAAPTIYKLVFEDQLAGLEVMVKAVSIKEFLALQRDLGEADSSADSADRFLKRMAGALVSWNLEDEKGKPVPANLDGLQRQELGLVMKIVTSWMGVVASLPNSSSASSNSGGTPLESSMPMTDVL